MSKHNVARMVAHSSRSALSSRRRGALLMSAATFALAISWPMSARAQGETALPSGGTVIGGTATIGTPSNAQLQINQSSNRAIINWESFDIGSGAGVTFAQPSASAIALNRVVGGSAPSQIAGQLNANGIVAVINSNGVVFAGTANVNVGGLIASAADVADEAFMGGGALSFTGSPSSMSEIIVNAGASISIADQGLGLFFAPVVRNAGVISARLGHVTLASSSSATLDLDGTGVLEIGLGNDSALVSNSGTINAGGGRIHMTAKAASAVIDQVVNSGILSVASATSDPDGTIILSAQSGNVVLGGSFDVGAAGSASVLAANEVKVESAVAATGDLSLTGRHISGAGEIDVTDGALALTLDVAGADTSGEGDFIGDALGVIGTVSGGVRLDLGAGTYAAGATIFHNDVTIDGGGVATIFVPINGSQINGLNVNADGATITGLTFASELSQGVKAWDYNWGDSITRGIAVANGADGVTISDNNMAGLRQGILIDGRGTNILSITGNLIDNTKSAILLQYVDGSASGFDISGNMQGSYGNEWGINLHLNGVWDGTNTTSGIGLLGANTSLENQARLLALSTANGGMAVLDQGYTASNRTHVTVSTTGSSSGQGAANTPLDTVQGGLNAVVTGGIVTVGAGSYVLTDTLNVTKSVTLTGQGQGVTILDASGHNAYGIRVKASDVTLSGFTLNGKPNATGNAGYGIKVEADGDSAARNSGFTIRDVTINNSRKNGLDLNAAVNALIDGVTVTGVAAGNGIAITDSANVTVRNSSTSGNAWGDVALYQTNNLNSGGRDQQLTGITIEANNDFAEATGLYVQDSSTLHDVGTLAIQGYGYTVRNPAHRQDGAQFTFFQKTQQDAFDYSVNLAAPEASVVQGWTGTAGDANFYVGFGALTGGGSAALSLQTAFDKSVDGSVIHVGSGTYAQSASLTGRLGLEFDNVTLDSLTLSGSGSSLRGNLALTGAGFNADAPLLLNGNTSITALSGNISIAGASGNAALLLTGNGVTLGQSSLGSVGVTGAQISTANVTTSGAQSYAGATSLSGSFSASDFAVTGSTSLASGTSVTASGAARFGAVDGASAGGQSFVLAAGTAEMGAIGSQTRLGATTISANQTVLGGAAYNADSLSFIGTGGDASVRVTQALTRFDTRAAGGNVSVAANLIGTSAGAQNVEILTGTGLAGGASEGAILLANLGSDALRLGSLSVVGGDFSAATVKLAGDFNSALSGNQVFTSNTLDTLGNVSAVVNGSESGPIRAGGSVAVDAGSSGNGSIIAGGPVQLSYISDVARDVSSQSSVSVASSGSVGGSISAAGPVAVNAVGPVSSSVTTGGSVEIASGGGISSNVTAGGAVNMTAATGDIVGAINASGPVSVGATQGSISSSISTTGSASLSSGSGISSAINAGGSVAVSSPGAITSNISAGGSIQLTSDTPINVVLHGGSVTVNAPGGTVGGVFNAISTGDGGSFVVNNQPVVGSGQANPRQIIVDTFLAPVGGSIGASGEIILPAGMALGLIGPSGGRSAQRPTVIVNSVEGLGDLLRRGYTGIIIQIDESGLELEREVASAT